MCFDTAVVCKEGQLRRDSMISLPPQAPCLVVYQGQPSIVLRVPITISSEKISFHGSGTKALLSIKRIKRQTLWPL